MCGDLQIFLSFRYRKHLFFGLSLADVINQVWEGNVRGGRASGFRVTFGLFCPIGQTMIL